MVQYLKSVLIFLTFITIATAHTFLGWMRFPGGAYEISARGNEVWAINRRRAIYRFDNGNGTWVKMPGNAVRAGASPDGSTWIINNKQDVFRFNKPLNKWEPITGQKLMQISAASKDRAIGVNRAQKIFLYEGNGWTPLPGSAKWATICDNDERWIVNKLDQIYRWNHTKNDWQNVPGSLKNIDCQNADRVIGSNRGGAMYVFEHGAWSRMPGNCHRATITGDMAFCSNRHHALYVGKFGPSAATGGDKEEHHHTAIVILETWERIDESKMEDGKGDDEGGDVGDDVDFDDDK